MTERPEPTPLTLSFSYKMDLDLPTLIEIVAGIAAREGPVRHGKRSVMRAIKAYLIEVGRANLTAWRLGTPQDRQEELERHALDTIVRALRKDVFPDLEPIGYMRRLTEWKSTLDWEQRHRYTGGKLKAFAEPGRRTSTT